MPDFCLPVPITTRKWVMSCLLLSGHALRFLAKKCGQQTERVAVACGSILIPLKSDGLDWLHLGASAWKVWNSNLDHFRLLRLVHLIPRLSLRMVIFQMMFLDIIFFCSCSLVTYSLDMCSWQWLLPLHLVEENKFQSFRGPVGPYGLLQIGKLYSYSGTKMEKGTLKITYVPSNKFYSEPAL